MHKSILIVILFISAGAGSWGQDHKVHPLQQAPVSFGVKGGVNFSLMDPESRPGSAPIEYHPLHGGYIGVFLHWSLARQWAFRPELLLSAHGFGAQHDAGNTLMIPPDDHFVLGYIHLPLLLQYTAPAGVVLQAGLQPGVRFRRIGKLKPADLAWVVGAGHVSRSGVGVEVRYTAGLINLADGDDEYKYLASVKNRVLQLGLVNVFHLRKRHGEKGDVLTRHLFR